jgi:hypothetical protein
MTCLPPTPAANEYHPEKVKNLKEAELADPLPDHRLRFDFVHDLILYSLGSELACQVH